jgi:hypothetical protein
VGLKPSKLIDFLSWAIPVKIAEMFVAGIALLIELNSFGEQFLAGITSNVDLPLFFAF